MAKFVHYATAIGAGLLIAIYGNWGLLAKIVFFLVAVDLATSMAANKIADSLKKSKDEHPTPSK